MTFSDSDILVDWPLLDELKQWRDVDGSEWDGDADDTRFTAELEAAIAYVKSDVGAWDELTDLPTVSMQRAAMRMAVLMRENAGIDPRTLSADGVYQTYMSGQRRRFAFA